jgi:hypothetical protein
MTEREIIEKIAAMDPDIPSEIDGDISCYFCRAWAAPTVVERDRDFSAMKRSLEDFEAAQADPVPATQS